ncbi:hypothetical protein WISP_142636 [Willisornis vidua]|uniref:Synaptonemal complex protein 2 n=1 Tax=Willisornis vidua TaxID=1566151 RepID=A0ABQ9CLR3_9PASS|nr:hypothetical protein WISP_142636 [Willisornis vidua]
MTARSEVQFEKLIDEATRKKDSHVLEKILALEDSENVSYKCSKQFVNKLDKLLCQTIKIVLFSLYMVNWFEKLKEILILRGSEKNDMITSLAEDFFNVLLVVCDSRPEGKIQILENFVLRTCSLITDVRISIYVQEEVVRKLNLMLDNVPRDAKKKLFSTKEMLHVMNEMGRRILDAGDYDMQVAITEALCRMSSEKQRGELASQWFSMEFVSNAFKAIKDSEFETDCRKFLNQVNGMLGDKRRVFTYPCLSAALDKYELQIPMDENLEEFWIDFNVGSRSISFYVAADDAGASKKQTASVAKTAVNVIFDESGSQVLVPESQLSPGLKERPEKKEKLSKDKTQQLPGSLRTQNKNNSQEKPRGDSSTCTMVKFFLFLKIIPSHTRKVSEASVLVPGTTRSSMRSPLTFVSTSRVEDTFLHSEQTKEKAIVPLRKEPANPKPSKTKPKSKELTDAAKSLISKISDRYKDKSDEKGKARDSLGFNRNDIYNFNISASDQPTIKFGTKTNEDKKHLFSDSDTENRENDSKTDISWLHESKRKPKAQIVNYTRNKKLGKPINTDKNCFVVADESPEPAFHMDKPKGKNANKKKVNSCKKQNSKPAEKIEQSSRKKLPRKAAAAKNYKEPSSSESESEGPIPTCTSKQKKSKTQKLMNGTVKDYKQQKAPQVVSVEPKTGENFVQKPLEKPRNSAGQKEVEISSAESPPSPETMRCAERISEGDVTPRHSSSERSLDLQESPPENRELLNSGKGISPENFYAQNKSIQSVCVNQSPEAPVTKSTFGKKSFSPVLTETSLLSLTTYKTVSEKNSKGARLETCHNNEDASFQRCFSDTLSLKGKLKDTTKAVTKNKELSLTTYKTDSGKHAKRAVSETGSNSEDPSFQFCFSDTLSVKGKLQDTTNPVTKNKEDCEPPSPLSASSGSKAQSSVEERYVPLNESGPTVQPFLKQTYHSDTESSSDEAETSKEEEKKRRRRISLKPRKLFKRDDAVTCRVSESISTRSVHELTALQGQFWEPACSTLSICQKLQKEFTKKMEARPFNSHISCGRVCECG